MTPEQSQINQLKKRLNSLLRQVRCGEVLYSDEALSGTVPCNYKLGVDSTTGDIYYKDETNIWQLAASGGGGGTGFGFSARYFGNVDGTINEQNTTDILSGAVAGSLALQSDDFADAIVLLIIGNVPVLPYDSGTGDLFMTKSLNSDTIVLSEALTADDPLDILIFGAGSASGGGGIQSIVEGANITVDNTDPQNPIVSAANNGIQSIIEGTNITIDNTDPLNPIISSAGGGGTGWGLTGNSGTDNSINFIGTTDDIDLTVRRNDNPVLTFYSDRTYMETTNVGSNDLSAASLAFLNMLYGSNNCSITTGQVTSNTIFSSNFAFNVGSNNISSNTIFGANALGSMTGSIINTTVIGTGAFSGGAGFSGGVADSIIISDANSASGAIDTISNSIIIGKYVLSSSASSLTGVILIGNSINCTDIVDNNLSNVILIGNNISTDQDDTCLIGDAAIKVGIRTPNPTQALHIGGDGNILCDNANIYGLSYSKDTYGIVASPVTGVVGVGGTVTVVGAADGGIITVTTTSPISSGIIAQITYPVPYPNGSAVTISSANGQMAKWHFDGLATTGALYVESDQNGFTISTADGVLDGSDEYKISYTVKGF